MRWIGVPDDAVVYIETAKLYPAVGGPDDLTDELDHFVDTRTGSCTVIDLLDNGDNG